MRNDAKLQTPNPKRQRNPSVEIRNFEPRFSILFGVWTFGLWNFQMVRGAGGTQPATCNSGAAHKNVEPSAPGAGASVGSRPTVKGVAARLPGGSWAS
jgi:hypothetical protein